MPKTSCRKIATLSTNAGLIVGTVTQQNSATVQAGSVISQTPAAGTAVISGSALNLVVSSGPQEILVPNLIGLTQAQANLALSLANLNVGNVMTTFSDGSAFRLSHIGASDPIVEGFTVTQCCAPSTFGPLANDLGRASWSITGQTSASQYSQYVYGLALSSTQQSILSSQGFALTFVARVSQGVAPAYDAIHHTTVAGAVYETATRRFEVDLGVDSAGDTVVVLPSSIDNTGPIGIAGSPGASYTLTGSGSSYHNYQLVYNPLTQLANLWVDGVERLQNYAGHTSFTINRGLVWGAYSGGQGNFSLVELASPVPAYSTGLVIIQTPAANTLVASGSLVDLTLASAGLVQVSIPNVVGQDQASATTTLINAGLVVGTVTQQSSNTVTVGNVISQTPAAGTSVVIGSVVNLVVSSGIPMVTTPNVVGQLQADAGTVLTSAGLIAGTITQQISYTVTAGDVISQNPAAGASVASGSAVDLIISTGPQQWNSGTDFSAASTNPNGPWSYGYSPSEIDPSVTLYDLVGPTIESPAITYWNSIVPPAGSTNSTPSVFGNPTGGIVAYLPNITFGPQQIALQPGSNGYNSVARWTAPASGRYQISATFSGLDAVGATTDVHVTKATLNCTTVEVTTLFDGIVNGFGASSASVFNSAVPIYLAAGESIDFRVGYGSNANFLNDTTALSVSITATEPPPVFSTIYSDNFNLDANTRIVGADLNGQPVETSTVGPVNWTSSNLYIDGKNTFASNAGNGFITQNPDHSSSLASLPSTLGAGIYQISADIYPQQPANPDGGWMGLGFFTYAEKSWKRSFGGVKIF